MATIYKERDKYILEYDYETGRKKMEFSNWDSLDYHLDQEAELICKSVNIEEAKKKLM